MKLKRGRVAIDRLRKIWFFKPLESVLVGITSGKVYGSPLTKVAPNHYQFRPGSIRKVVRDGIRYRLDLSDIVDWFVYFGFRETARTELYKLMHEGQVFVDVGANMGDVTLHAASLLGEGGQVISLEPDPLNFRRLMTNLSLNSFKNIEVYNVGAGNKAGTELIYNVSEGNQGMNRILSKVEPNMVGREITLTTLDQLFDEIRPSRVDLIKIDTEGFEMNALEGARRTIERFSPIFFIEIDDNNLKLQNSTAKGLIDFLTGFGYSCRNAENGLDIDPTQDYSNCHFDLIAVRNIKSGL